MRATAEGRLRGVFETIERAFEARSTAELDSVMAEAFAEYGVTHFAVDQMRDGAGQLVGIHHFGRRNEQWGGHYLHERHYRHDGIIRRALRTPLSVRWRQAKAQRDLLKQEKRLFGEAHEFGLKDGVITPVHLADGAVAAVTLTAPEALELSPSDEAAIHMLSLHYHSRGMFLKNQALSAEAQKKALTERQRECLQWVRAGKTSWEIGQIIGIKERTVDFHLEAVCRRLQVTTRNQAVIEAIVLGLIAL